MKTLTPTSALVALVLPAVLVLADYTNNQLDEPAAPWTPPASSRQRPMSFGRRLPVKSCRDCGANECQVMGMQRFSEPRCEALGGLGAPCRMWQEPENKTLHLPNAVLRCNHVYMQLCPCQTGLVCDEAECRRPRAAAKRPQAHTWGLRDLAEQEEDEDLMPLALESNESKLQPWAIARFH